MNIELRISVSWVKMSGAAGNWEAAGRLAGQLGAGAAGLTAGQAAWKPLGRWEASMQLGSHWEAAEKPLGSSWDHAGRPLGWARLGYARPDQARQN